MAILNFFSGKISIIILSALAFVLLYVIPAVIFVANNVKVSADKEYNYSVNMKLLTVTGCILFSVLCIRFAVICYGDGKTPIQSFSQLFEFFARSILESLQTLSLDAPYEDILKDTVDIYRNIFALADGSAWLKFIQISVALQCLAGPIFSGATIFDFIANFFPKIKLKLIRSRELYIFSELNERSYQLALSVFHYKKYKRREKPVIVFTDTYVSSEDEDSSELYMKAKGLGAICVKEDITAIKPLSKKRRYFLIDEKEVKNLEALAILADEDHCSMLTGNYIYVFYKDDSYVLTERGIMKNLEEYYADKYGIKIEKKLKKIYKRGKAEPHDDLYKALLAEYMPIPSRIVYQKNTLYNLLNDMPLFTPLLDRSTNIDNPNEFNLTLFGFGEFGLQMFINSTWCGQFIGYNLCINVATRESKEKVISRINTISPEILQSADQNSSILNIFKDEEEKSPKYFTFRYANAEFKDIDFSKAYATDIYAPAEQGDTAAEKVSDEENKDSAGTDSAYKHSLLDSDYYFVSLGSDADNISVAEKLGRAISIQQKAGSPKKTVIIALAIFDKHLKKVFTDAAGSMYKNVKFYVFGSLDEVFCWNNVSMKRLEPYANKVNEQYELTKAQARIKSEKVREKASYDLWSSSARSVHLKYRVFSALLYKKYLTSSVNNKVFLSKLDFTEDEYRKYIDIITSSSPTDIKVGKYLAWLEHRRWNAYTRANGFVYSDDSKDLVLKQHGCLVECKNDAVCKDPNKSDLLDDYEEKKKSDYKIYDYPGSVDDKLIDYFSGKEDDENSNNKKSHGKVFAAFSVAREKLAGKIKKVKEKNNSQ